MADIIEINSALLHILKLKAAEQASRNDRNSIKGDMAHKNLGTEAYLLQALGKITSEL